MTDYKKLRERALAATPLPDRNKRWFATEETVYWEALSDDGKPTTVPQTFVEVTIVRHGALEFIAAASPDVVIGLLDDNERLRKQNNLLSALAVQDSDARNRIREVRDQENDDLRSQLAAAQAEVERLQRSAASWEADALRHANNCAWRDERLTTLTTDRDRLDEACDQLITERDHRESQIDRIADELGDEGEWSNLHDRGDAAIELAAGLVADRDRLAAIVAGIQEERDGYRAALEKISAIRDSIVGMQGFNFSEHAYPLVAALNEAGFKGAGYEIARANLGTLIEQTKRAEEERDGLREMLAATRNALNEACDLVDTLRGVHDEYADEYTEDEDAQRGYRERAVARASELRGVGP